MPSSKIYFKNFFPLPFYTHLFSFRTPEVPAQMKIRMIPGMPGEPGVTAPGPVAGEPPTP